VTQNRGEGKGQQELQKRVLDTQLCTGCGACIGLCPYQAYTHDNVVALHGCDMKEGKCYAFCPRTPTDLDGLRKHFFGEEEITPELGAMRGFYIARSAEEQVRKKAQHGGTVTTLIALALREGMIDAAVVAENQTDCLPRAVVVTDPEKLRKCGKSSFVASPMIAKFNEITKSECQKVGVVATPCQALAIAKMRSQSIQKGYETMDKLKLVIGLFCGWALSWRKIVELLRKKTDLETITGMDIPPSKYHTLEVLTKNGPLAISLDEVTPCIREACHYCYDMTAEFSDISVGSARLSEGWDVARSWNQVIVRTQQGDDLMELARTRGLLEFRDVPEGNLERLKQASQNKKKTAIKNLIKKSRRSNDLLYLDHRDPDICTFMD
jgi:coenzyme F420 hydrogenase subunit beta